KENRIFLSSVSIRDGYLPVEHSGTIHPAELPGKRNTALFERGGIQESRGYLRRNIDQPAGFAVHGTERTTQISTSDKHAISLASAERREVSGNYRRHPCIVRNFETRPSGLSRRVPDSPCLSSKPED